MAEIAQQESKPKTHVVQLDMQYGGLLCTCGQGKRHRRFKVLDVWLAKHTAKTGHPFLPPKEEDGPKIVTSVVQTDDDI